MDDVAIVGVGLHPFGRFPGVTGIQMGAVATRAALADAGVEWRDIQFAFGGSYEVDNPDAVVSLLGLTGIPFTDVYNGCATAASALTQAANTIRLGDYDLGIAIGMDKHLPGAFSADPEQYACPSWYGDLGHFITTKFFGMKINKYMHDHGISAQTLAKVAAKSYRNGALNPNAFRRKPLTEEQILESAMLNHPLTHYMFCSPDEGAAAVVLCRADRARNYTDTPIYLRASTVRTRRLGAFEVHSPWLPIEETEGPTVDASRAAYEMAGIGPEDVDVIQLQDTDAGAEVIHLAENGFCKDGDQEALVADGALEIGGALPTNTDGGLIANGEPIGASGLRQIHEVVLQLRGTAGERQVPGSPKVGYTQLYGAPGTAGVSIVSR
ncbi:MAG TPA: thiolase family protein [Mycobacteriales bacterium]|nr:thiolase family protein [Mycobacteriales bacterium]